MRGKDDYRSGERRQNAFHSKPSGPIRFGAVTLASRPEKLERFERLFRPILLFFCAIIALTADRCAFAASFDTGTDLSVSWNNTIRLSATYQFNRTSLGYSGYCPSREAGTPDEPSEDGCALQSGFMSGRGDWISELDLDYHGYGLLVSSAAWYDAVNRKGAYDAPDASEHGGEDIELFDAFAHGETAIGTDQTLSFRVGRQDLIWGESRYFTQDGIAGGQAPIDTYRMQGGASGYGSKTPFLPVGLASFRWQTPGDFAIEGYYQFEWRRSRIDPRDAYTGTTDILGAEGNNLIALSKPIYGIDAYARLPDRQPASSDRFGLALKWHRDDFDFGLYGLKFDAKSPQIYLYGSPPASGAPYQGAYRLEYPEGIELYGVSASGPLGNANFGAELSARRNMPLVNGSVFVPSALAATADNDNNPRYPLGDTLHAQFSLNYVIPPASFLPDGATWTGELAIDRLLGTTANANQLIPGRTRTAAAFRWVFEPQFFQVVPRVDLSVPIGLGYNFLGLSEVDSAMNRGTGDVTLGVAITVDQVWKGSLGYTHYFGQWKGAPTPFENGYEERSLSDWDFIGVTLERSF
jgi:hypothetical protein